MGSRSERRGEVAGVREGRGEAKEIRFSRFPPSDVVEYLDFDLVLRLLLLHSDHLDERVHIDVSRTVHVTFRTQLVQIFVKDKTINQSINQSIDIVIPRPVHVTASLFSTLSFS